MSRVMTGCTSIPWRAKVGLTLGAAVAAVLLFVQESVALGYAYEWLFGGWGLVPWAVTVELILATIVPATAIIVWMRERHIDEPLSDKFERIEWLSGSLALILLFPSIAVPVWVLMTA